MTETTAGHMVPESSEASLALNEQSNHQTMLGEGPLPAVLEGFNWGAYFFPVFWAMRYAVWRVLVPLLVGLAFWNALDSLAPRGHWLLSVTAAPGVIELSVAILSLWLGVNGNRLAWEAAARRVDRGLKEPKTVANVINGQAWWILFGALLTLFVLYGGVVAIRTGLPIDRGEAPLLLSAVVQVSSLGVAVYVSRSRGWLWSKLNLTSRGG